MMITNYVLISIANNNNVDTTYINILYIFFSKCVHYKINQ